MSVLTDFQWKRKYTPADGNLIQLFYVPALGCATRYDRSTGYFSAAALALAARGIEGLVRNEGHMRLVVGCTLKEPEVEAIQKGESLRDAVAGSIGRMPLQPESPVEKDALELLAWMIASGMLDVKVAVPCGPDRRPIASNGIFHEKAGIIEDRTGLRLAWNGSLNETVYGWQENWESINVFRSWDEQQRVDDEDENFSRIWSGVSPYVLTVDVPTALREELMRFLPETDEPARLKNQESRKDGPGTPEIAESPEESDEELRRKVWHFIRTAPASDAPGAERIGEATSAVQPWPHQIVSFQRMYRNWPPRLLIADEVGLGKTIQAGMLMRQAWMAGKAKRILILAPKAVLKQWQIELREKFNLNWPIYDGQKLCWYPSRSLNGNDERAVPPTKWHEEPVVITSSQLMRRTDRSVELLRAEDWDLIILDEAHHARRKSPGASHDHGPNMLLNLMWQLRTRTKGLLLLTATPMQVHPVEVWDLLNLIGLPEGWTDRAFLAFYDRISRPMPSHEDMEALASLFRAVEQANGEFSREEISKRLAISGPLAKRLLRILRGPSTIDRRGLTVVDRQKALDILRITAPIAQLISRNTRELLRHYFKTGQMDTQVATRDVQDVFLEMTPAERETYEEVESYIRDSYNQASPDERNAVGFVMTIYRKRLASSFYALKQTLLKRKEAILSPQLNQPIFTDEDVPDDDELEETDDSEISAAERAALTFNDLSTVEALLNRIETLPEDTKSVALRRVVREMLENGYKQVMIFTQFTDTLIYLRKELLKIPDLRVLCYSGRGGEEPLGHGQWARVSREEARRKFSRGEADILLCTDSAAEGLNFQFCGALINYDLPWNPMRVEQRIGRIDRLGQKYSIIRITNLHYQDTIETNVYVALKERIGMFTSTVGRLQPILSRLAGKIKQATLSSGDEAASSELVSNIETELADAAESGFDLDKLTIEQGVRAEPVAPLYDLGYLQQVLLDHSRLIPGIHVEQRSDKEFFYLAAGMGEKVRITTNSEYYNDHLEDVELWSPGNPIFPWAE